MKIAEYSSDVYLSDNSFRFFFFRIVIKFVQLEHNGYSLQTSFSLLGQRLEGGGGQTGRINSTRTKVDHVISVINGFGVYHVINAYVASLSCGKCLCCPLVIW